MGSDDDPVLRLNELNRFRKTSSRMALEAHSHCEVPAGCGGVVLRWTSPGAPLGVTLSKYFARPVDDLCLDGSELTEQRATVTPGAHVISFTMDVTAEEGFVLATLRLEPDLPNAAQRTKSSRADGSWRATLSAPEAGDAWRLPDFEDSAYVPLVERAVPEPHGNRAFMWEWLTKEATGLGLDEPDASRPWWKPFQKRALLRAWVRWCFTVDHEGFR
jgi:hypothetical protein